MTDEELREFFFSKRATLSPKELEEISEKVCHEIFSNFQLENKKISLFLPEDRKKEINTYKILEKAISFDAEVAIPKYNSKNKEVKHILFESIQQLELSELGYPEPKKGKIIAAEHFDYVIIPILGIDVNGSRLGFGNGIYERFLKKCAPRCKFIGLSHFDDFEPSFSKNLETTIKLHYCISPSKTTRF